MSATLPAPSAEASGADLSPKRRQMRDAAEQLFLAHGYGAVSMDAVARAAGVSKATLYAHFASKDALFATIVSHKGLDNPFGPGCFPPETTDLRADLSSIGQKVLRFMLRERTLAIYRIAIAESARFPELGQAFYANGPRRFCARFADWLAEPGIRAQTKVPDPGVAAEQLMAMLRSGVFLRASLAVPPAPTDAEIDATIEAAVESWMKAFAPGSAMG